MLHVEYCYDMFNDLKFHAVYNATQIELESIYDKYVIKGPMRNQNEFKTCAKNEYVVILVTGLSHFVM